MYLNIKLMADKSSMVDLNDVSIIAEDLGRPEGMEITEYLKNNKSFLVICYHTNGVIWKGNIFKDKEVEIDGIKYGLGMFPMMFHDNGKVSCGFFALDRVEKDGVIYRGGHGSPTSFYPNGKVEQGILGKGREFDGIMYNAGDIICFDEDGKVLPK